MRLVLLLFFPTSIIFSLCSVLLYIFFILFCFVLFFCWSFLCCFEMRLFLHNNTSCRVNDRYALEYCIDHPVCLKFPIEISSFFRWNTFYTIQFRIIYNRHTHTHTSCLFCVSILLLLKYFATMNMYYKSPFLNIL